jgi:hypothetical protein
MADVTYLTAAANETYKDEVFDYIRARREDIKNAADAVGISAGAIAGAMAEENHAYDYLDYVLDLYTKSAIDPVIAAATLPAAMASGPAGLAAWEAANAVALTTTTRSHEDWVTEYEAFKANNWEASKINKILHPVLMDVGPANFKVATAIRLVNTYADEFGFQEYRDDYALLVNDLMGVRGTLLASQLRSPSSNIGRAWRRIFPRPTAMLTPARDIPSIRATSAPLQPIIPTAR